MGTLGGITFSDTLLTDMLYRPFSRSFWTEYVEYIFKMQREEKSLESLIFFLLYHFQPWLIFVLCLAYPIGLDTTISTCGADWDSRIILYTSFFVAPGKAFPFHCNTSSPEIKKKRNYLALGGVLRVQTD